MKINEQPVTIISIGMIAASGVLATVYFGLSRLFNEYVISFLLAILGSFYVLALFSDLATQPKSK